MAWFWLSLAIALTVVEMSTVQLVSVWFALGAGVTSLVKAIFPSIGIGWQLLIFVAVSVALFVSTRPVVKKFLTKRTEAQKTNLDLVVGKEAIVVEEINNIKGTGAVKLGGMVWSARTLNGEEIPLDTIVVFKEISGNKAMVERKGE